VAISGIDQPPTDLKLLAGQLKVLAEPRRLRILHMLMEGVQCNCELGDALDMAPNLTSHHLRVLREAGLVDVERDPDDARWVYYSLNLEALEGLIAYLRPRVAITDYVDYQARGLTIGSGIMESTCKQLVGQRLKGNGRQWSEGGAVAMTALIGQRINRSWDVFWASRPIHRAA